MSWQQKVKEHYESRILREKLERLDGLYVYSLEFTLPQAVQQDKHNRITEPYWGGDFETASRVIDIVDVINLVTKVAGQYVHICYVEDGVVFGTEACYEPLEEEHLQAFMEHRIKLCKTKHNV